MGCRDGHRCVGLLSTQERDSCADRVFQFGHARIKGGPACDADGTDTVANQLGCSELAQASGDNALMVIPIRRAWRGHGDVFPVATLAWKLRKVPWRDCR